MNVERGLYRLWLALTIVWEVLVVLVVMLPGREVEIPAILVLAIMPPLFLWAVQRFIWWMIRGIFPSPRPDEPQAVAESVGSNETPELEASGDRSRSRPNYSQAAVSSASTSMEPQVESEWDSSPESEESPPINRSKLIVLPFIATVLAGGVLHLSCGKAADDLSEITNFTFGVLLILGVGVAVVVRNFERFAGRRMRGSEVFSLTWISWALIVLILSFLRYQHCAEVATRLSN